MTGADGPVTDAMAATSPIARRARAAPKRRTRRSQHVPPRCGQAIITTIWGRDAADSPATSTSATSPHDRGRDVHEEDGGRGDRQRLRMVENIDGRRGASSVAEPRGRRRHAVDAARPRTQYVNMCRRSSRARRRDDDSSRPPRDREVRGHAERGRRRHQAGDGAGDLARERAGDLGGDLGDLGRRAADAHAAAPRAPPAWRRRCPPCRRRSRPRGPSSCRAAR